VYEGHATDEQDGTHGRDVTTIATEHGLLELASGLRVKLPAIILRHPRRRTLGWHPVPEEERDGRGI